MNQHAQIAAHEARRQIGMTPQDELRLAAIIETQAVKPAIEERDEMIKKLLARLKTYRAECNDVSDADLILFLDDEISAAWKLLKG